MKTFRKRLFGALLAICVLSSIFCTAASAMDARYSDYLDSYVCSVTPKGNGKIVVSANVNAIINATQIGASDVYIYESSNNEDFTCVEEYHYEDYPNMMGSGRHFNRDVATYYGTPGKYYYAAVYVYAGDSTGGDTRSFDTASVRAYR